MRASFSLVSVSPQKAVLFGGYDGKQQVALPELYAISLMPRDGPGGVGGIEWQLVRTTGEIPPNALIGHAAVACRR